MQNCEKFLVYIKCIRLHVAAVLVLLVLTACVSDFPRHVMDPPWVPEAGDVSDEGLSWPDQNTIVPVFFDAEDIPVIDGNFDEWQGLDGPSTRVPVFGGNHVKEDAEAFFVLRTDGSNLFIYSRVTDDMPHINYLPGSMAWRGDTVEIFFGTATHSHKKYVNGDNQIRLSPRSKEDSSDVDIVINQRTVGTHLLSDAPGIILAASAKYHDAGYDIEASIPLQLLMIDELQEGKKIRCEFQINDADTTERDRLIHWIGTKDDPWRDPSTWGNGEIVPLPEVRKEIPDEL